MTDEELIAKFYLPCIKSAILHALHCIQTGKDTSYLTHILECAGAQTDLAMNLARLNVEVDRNLN